jgi:hypothetical protein
MHAQHSARALITKLLLLYVLTVTNHTHAHTAQKQGEMSELKQFFPPLWEDGHPVEDDPPPDSEADVVRWMRQLRQPTVTKGVSHTSTIAALMFFVAITT